MSRHYIAFIVLTFLIVKYSKKTFKNQEKKPAHIQVRVNFGFHWKHDGATPVMLDIFNDGDETCNNLEIDMYIKNVKYYEDTIQFIAPHELFSYFIGYLDENSLKMRWITGEESTLEFILDPGFFDVKSDSDSDKWCIEIHSDNQNIKYSNNSQNTNNENTNNNEH